MTAFCILAAPLHDLIRLRGRSVWAASILHGSINATAGSPSSSSAAATIS